MQQKVALKEKPMLDQAHPLMMFLQAFATQTIGYFAVIALVFVVVWRWGEVRFQGARIQAKKRFNRRQLVFEVKNTLGTLAIGTANAVVISLCYAAGLTKLSTDAAAFAWWEMLASFIGLLLLTDGWFYLWHRLLHLPWLYRRVHAVHHKSVDVNPFSVYSFHPFEAFILGSAVLPVLFLVPIYLPVLGLLQVVGLANNIMSHLGYEFLPRWYARIPPFRWLNTATFHSLHHTTLNGNYGLFFRVWDRMLGTEVPEYETTFLTRGAAVHAPTVTTPDTR
jgi:sterol desaturase/sphingolipid hydroxylase (fatty acid hydroxylase superfamily)